MSDERDPPRRPPGRPKAEPGTVLSTYVRTADYDRLVRVALKQDRSVAALVRDLLQLKLK